MDFRRLNPEIAMKQKRILTFLLFLISPLLSIPLILEDIFNKRKGAFFMFSCFIGILCYLYLPSEIQDNARRFLLYEELQNYSTDRFINEYLLNRTDLLFYVLIFLFVKLEIKLQLLFFLLGFLNSYIPLYVFSKIFEKYNLSKKTYFKYFILIVLSYSVIHLFSGVRNNLAISFVFLSYYYLDFADKKSKSIFFFILALITHFSVIIYLPIILLRSKIKMNLLFPLFGFIVIISFLLPDEIVQEYFTSIEVGNSVYDNKISAYSSTSLAKEKSTFLTLLAKILFDVWFYVAIIYTFVTRFVSRNIELYKAFLIFSIPVLVFISFPDIYVRYMLVAKFFFVILLIGDSLKWNNERWIRIFIFLLSIEPLYSVFRLMTQSFIAGYLRFENISLLTILMQTYTYKDMLPPY